jgi:hypothetical protein
MTRLDGRFIKAGSIPRDRLDPEIPIGQVDPGTVTAQMLAASLLDHFMVVVWGTPTEVEAGVQSIELGLVDLLGQAVLEAHILRLTCDQQASMAIGASGVALSGDGSEDLIAQTNSSGVLEVIVTCHESADISIAAGPTQLSPMLDCRAAAALSFN